MTTRKKILAAGLTALVLTAATGCGGEGDSSASRGADATGAHVVTHAAPAVDVSVVRGMTEYDYERAPSVTALARQEPYATLGEVVGWSDGRSVEESDGSGYVDTSYFAVLEIKVTKTYGAAAGRGAEERIYVEVPRGGEIKVNGEAPKGTEPVYSTIDELNTAVPAGTRVIVLGRDAATAAQLEQVSSDRTVHNALKGHPAGSNLLRAHVQGLLFEDETGAFVSGLADDEQQWGWVPRDVPARQGFGHLVAELNRMRR